MFELEAVLRTEPDIGSADANMVGFANQAAQIDAGGAMNTGGLNIEAQAASRAQALSVDQVIARIAAEGRRGDSRPADLHGEPIRRF